MFGRERDPSEAEMGLKKEGETRSVVGADLKPGDWLVTNKYEHGSMQERPEGGVKILRIDNVPSDPTVLSVHVEENSGLVKSILVHRKSEYEVVP